MNQIESILKGEHGYKTLTKLYGLSGPSLIKTWVAYYLQ